MNDLSDDDLMGLFQDGDADAFDVLFDRYHVPVYHFARSILREGPGAEDVLQETFLAVAGAAERYEPRGQFRAWLFRIVRNRCLNRLAAKRARRETFHAAGFAAAERPGPARPPDEKVQGDEERAAVRRALAELPDRQREALTLRAFEQMPYREIAAVMEMPINTVKTLIHRARVRLAAAIEEMTDETM
ncbi:MAG: sigma-70 family RNA polymerase sigma factor [Planctomycetota bacterium]